MKTGGFNKSLFHHLATLYLIVGLSVCLKVIFKNQFPYEENEWNNDCWMEHVLVCFCYKWCQS